MNPQSLKCLTALADPLSRNAAARDLAAFYGADSVILFAMDEGIGLPLPVSGFPQSLPEGQRWQSFLKECTEYGSAQQRLPLPGCAEPQAVVGIACQTGAVLVFVGGSLRAEAYTDMPQVLPVLHLAVKGEQIRRIAEANAQLAAERIAVAQRLAASLDKARVELARILVESRAAQRELRIADQKKNEFLALLAHELRNPLAPIGNALELLRLSPDDTTMIGKLRAIMQTQFTQMVRLIDDLMDVSRISTGKIFLKKEVCTLSHIVRSAIDAARPQFEARRQQLDVFLPADEATVLVDPVRLNQVFLNILKNAATFTPHGGRVCVRVEHAAEHVDVRISDTGKGIPADSTSKIFSMFIQGDDSKSRDAGGLGIGLSLAKSLVEMHGGTISAKSAGTDKGSTFTVCLPLHIPDPSSARAQTDVPTPAKDPALRILVVDDNADSATSMAWTLETLGHECRLAFDGHTAVRIAETFTPQLMLLDIGMPGMTGYELCADLKRRPALRDALYVAQTGWGLAQDKEKAKAAGFDFHLVKPVNIVELRKIIRSYSFGPAAPLPPRASYSAPD